MIFGVSPTKDAVVVAQTRGSGETFAITLITSIQFQARSGNDLTDLRQRLISIFDRVSRSQRSTVALLASSSGRFKSSVEAIKAEAITELAAAESGLPVVMVTAASLKKALGCATGQKCTLVQRNDSIRLAARRTGRTARPALRPRPSKSPKGPPEASTTSCGVQSGTARRESHAISSRFTLEA